MGQKLREDRIAAISQGGGIITLAPSILTIGGQQYVTSTLQRTITADVSLTARNIYFVYAVVSGGVVGLRISTNTNSLGPAGFTRWKLVGAFYTNASSAFDVFVSNSAPPAITRYLSGSGTHTTLPYATYLKLRMVGGGGGGGSTASSLGGSGGGGSGAYGEVTINSPAASYSYSVGAGGTPNGGTSTGNTGGTTSFGSFSVAGGAGGSGTTTNAASGTPGTGGAAPSGFDIALAGGMGANHWPGTSGVVGSNSGNGGTTIFGGAGRGGSANGSTFGAVAGAANTGGGGGGGSNASGASGGSGIVIVEEGRPNLEQLGLL